MRPVIKKRQYECHVLDGCYSNSILDIHLKFMLKLPR